MSTRLVQADMNKLIKEQVIKTSTSLSLPRNPQDGLKALRSKEVAGYAAPEEVASNIEDLCKLIE